LAVVFWVFDYYIPAVEAISASVRQNETLFQFAVFGKPTQREAGSSAIDADDF